MAESPADLEMAARLRYAVYVGEQSKAYPEADHTYRRLADGLDAEAATVLVFAGSELVGTVRGNWLPSDRLMARYAATLELERFSQVRPEAIGVCSRLAVNPDFRDSNVRRLLFETIYEMGLARSTSLCFATCTGRLLRLFLSYGFREYAPTLFDSAAGELHRTVLVLDDIAHLERVRSPFLQAALRRGVNHTDRPWLTDTLAVYGNRLL